MQVTQTCWQLGCLAAALLIAGNSMAQFDLVLNLPQDGNLPDFFEIPNNTQVNVYGGNYNPDTQEFAYGRIGYNVTAGMGDVPANIEINLYGPQVGEDYGGEIDWDLTLYDGATLNVFGGSVLGYLAAYEGSQVNISGGSLHEWNILDYGASLHMTGGTIGMGYSYLGRNGMSDFAATGGLEAFGGHVILEGGILLGGFLLDYNASVDVHGDEFLLNGEAIPDLAGVGASTYLFLNEEDLLTGVLADGTPVALTGKNTLAELQLFVAPVPAAGPSNILVDDFSDLLPTSVRSGQTLTVSYQYAGLYNYQEAPPLVVGRGGTARLEAGYYDPIGGVVAQPGATLAIAGTAEVSTVWADRDSQVTIEGGDINTLHIRAGSEVTVFGGTVYAFDAGQSEGTLILAGGNYRLNGQLIAGLEIPDSQVPLDLLPGDVLTGELADGRPVMLYGGDQLADGVLRLVSNAPAAPTQTTLTIDSNTTLDHAREGQTLNVVAGGRLPDRFRAGYGSRVNFVGGTSLYGLEALGGSEVVVSSGNVVPSIFANAQSQVTVAGGTLDYVSAAPGSQLSITGGELRSGFIEGRAEMTGGSTARFYVYNQGEVEVTGGSLDLLQLASGTTATLVGTSFQVDGADVTSLLSVDTPYVVTQRNVVVEGVLADGSPIGDLVSSLYTDNNWYAASGATLQLLLAAAPPLLVGDYNNDGTVDLADYVVWRNNLGTTNLLANDPIGNTIGTDHYLQWKDHFGNTWPNPFAPAMVPEPSLMIPALVLLIAAAGCRSPRRLQ